MKDSNQKLKVHIKNNKWAEGSFPNTPEAEKVFTITEKRFQESLDSFPLPLDSSTSDSTQSWSTCGYIVDNI